MIPADTKKPEDDRSLHYRKREGKVVKPFLKLARGKGQLLKEINDYYPFDDKITKYAEPFVGGGAVLFDILSWYDLDEVYISEINAEVINTYCVIRDNIDKLISFLLLYQTEYGILDSDARKDYYMKKGACFNDLKTNGNEDANIKKAALMIFLNKTYFNGLYRVNRKGLFNVPTGSYKMPPICDTNNLHTVSNLLSGVDIRCGDYSKCESFIDCNTFVYIDPPYRPLTQTASFTSYPESKFGDKQQIELSEFVSRISPKGARVVVSNSDPQNADKNDMFFDELYSAFCINRVVAKQMINRFKECVI